MINWFKESKSFLDKLILFFFVLFLASLNNSIFINQIGYFCLLILLLVKFAYERKNPFRKSGLEIYFLLFLLAEIVSAIFSEDTSEAFRNVFKRAILIPIFYVTSSILQKEESVTSAVKIYLGAALLTILAYLIFAYEHFTLQLYQAETKGPSPFQYVMTAGGLISFTAIFLFSQLFNKKLERKYFFALTILFSISIVALIASYTRAAWIGSLAGFIVLILLNKKWWFIVLPVVALSGFLIFFPNESKLILYDVNGSSFSVRERFESDGKTPAISKIDSLIYFADNSEQVGVYTFKDKRAEITFPAVISNIYYLSDNKFIALSVEGRFFLVEKTIGGYEIQEEFLSPGLPSAVTSVDGSLLVADIDSGITVFDHTYNSVNRYPDRNIIALGNFDGRLLMAKKKSGIELNEFVGTELQKIGTFTLNINLCQFLKTDSSYFASTDKGLYKISFAENKFGLKLISSELRNVILVWQNIDRNIILERNGFLYSADYNFLNIEKVESRQLENPIHSAVWADSILLISVGRANRLSSIFDPNHLTNIQRVEQWKAAWRAALSNPFTGVGDIDMKEIHAKFKSKFEKEKFGHFHNNYFHMLAALGFIGGFIFLLMLFAILYYHWKTYEEVSHNEKLRTISAAALAIFIGFLISGLAEFNFGDHEIITVVWFTLGLQFSVRNILRRESNA